MLVLFGGNLYGAGMGNARLRGCDPDLRSYYDNWQRNHYVKGVKAVVLADQTNIAQRVRDSIAIAVSICDKQPAALHDSSHGTFIGGDGALVSYNSDWNDYNTFVRAVHLRNIFKTAPAGGRIYLTIDACTFGNSVRALEMLSLPSDPLRQNRFMQPDLGTLIENVHLESEVDANAPVEIDHRDMPQVACISGCLRGADYTCADVTDNSGHSFGAFTRAFTTVKRNGMTAREITDAVNKEFARSGEEQRAVCSGGLVDKVWMS
jgi:hypothetical protein